MGIFKVTHSRQVNHMNSLIEQFASERNNDDSNSQTKPNCLIKATYSSPHINIAQLEIVAMQSTSVEYRSHMIAGVVI